MDKLLLITTLYHDIEDAREMIKSLSFCELPGSESWPGHTGVAVENAAETPEPANLGIHRLRANGASETVLEWSHMPGRRMGLPEALNHAIGIAISHDFDYVGWIHPDMRFDADLGWVRACVDHLKASPGCGKASPQEQRTIEAAAQWLKNRQEAAMPMIQTVGNACPWICRIKDLAQLKKIDKFVFDEAYDLLAFEDWDFNNRIWLKLGLRPEIISWATVAHRGMGTRDLHDYGGTFEKNRRHYVCTYGTDRPLIG